MSRHPRLLLLPLLVLLLSGPAVLRNEAAERRSLSREDLLDRIRGGWAGQMIGVAYGAKSEFQSNGKIGEWDLPWSPGMLENAITQDDLYVEMTFARVMDEHGIDAPARLYGEALRDSQYHLWHANAAARRLLAQGIQPPWSGDPRFNIHANDIDFQIESDFIGLMSPGLPRVSNRLCDRIGHVMNYGDGVYGGMFIGGMYAAAFFERDPRRVVEAGLACIPARSGYGRLIADLLGTSARRGGDWQGTWHEIQERWDRNDPCPDGALRPFNIDARLNGAYVAFGLLFGGGDFERTMEVATRCGQDSDCNPSSAAGILGVMLGYRGIPAGFTADLAALADRHFDFTAYSFNDIVGSTEARALQVIRKSGGKVTETSVEIPFQKPSTPRLEQWNPGIPDRLVPVVEGQWSWTGEWTDTRGARTSTSAGAVATLTFEGVGVVLMGPLDQAGGRAEVWIDGRKRGIADAYIVPNTHDAALWHIHGLRAGLHELKLVTLGEHDERSTGHRVGLTEAVVYRAGD